MILFTFLFVFSFDIVSFAYNNLEYKDILEKNLMGANYTLTVGRGSSTWKFSVINNPYDS